MTENPAINGERLLIRIDAFAAIGATGGGGVNRQALTPLDRDARALLARLGRERGFSVHQDAIANLFIRREGKCADLPPLLIGSHLDSQPAGGRFDGALGTLTAFEVLETLEDRGIETERAVEVVAWTNEEGCRFAPGCMGSAAFAAGAIPAPWNDATATDGAAFPGELAATLAALPEAAMRPLGFPIHAYIELHIEQGPSLERQGIPIGIVTGIQGTRWLDIAVRGRTAHAGTTALDYRRDPMWAMVCALAQLYPQLMPADERARFTVGRMSAEPGSVNAIPEVVRCTIDIRHPEASEIDRMTALTRAVLAEQAKQNGCSLDIRQTFDMPPASFPDATIGPLRSAAKTEGLAVTSMLSGAFHDALFINRVAPSAMIFVPCRDGLSHNEDEFVEPRHSVTGAQMLMSATLQIVRETCLAN